MQNDLWEVQTLEVLIAAVAVSWCRVFEEALQNEIIIHIFCSLIPAACCCWNEAKQLSPFSQPQGWVRSMGRRGEGAHLAQV